MIFLQNLVLPYLILLHCQAFYKRQLFTVRGVQNIAVLFKKDVFVNNMAIDEMVTESKTKFFE